MTASILSIGTALPQTRLPQDHVRDLFAGQPGNTRMTQRLIRAAFDASGIAYRHTVLADLADPPSGTDGEADTGLRVIDASRTLLSPPTSARNAAYIRHAPPLFAAAARAALDDAGLDPLDVTHVVTVSCTGMVAPGPDYRLVRDLGLAPTVERCHLGFIGCAAALPALRTASHICAAHPGAVVLVVCAELCSLHLRASADPEQIVASSVFADGAAAAIVSAAADRRRGPVLDLDRFGTTLTADGEEDMVWTVGDHGFEMTLSAEVPRIIGREIRAAVDSFLRDEKVDVWAVHPGGRSVLERVQAGLDLDAAMLAASYRVLRERGNMSSATILFILRELLLDDGQRADARIAALAFGPGLTVESALLTRRSADRR